MIDFYNLLSNQYELIQLYLSENIENESAALNELYNEILKQTVSLKTDMPSAIGVLISYQDNDGD